MPRFLRRWLDKLPTSDGLLNYGQWRVRYNTGKWTRKMTFDAATDYARAFGGVVYWVRYDDPHQKEVPHD